MELVETKHNLELESEKLQEEVEEKKRLQKEHELDLSNENRLIE